MSAVNEIIVLDDDEDEEEPPRPAKAKASLRNSPKQTNGKAEESSSSQRSKAETISAENKALFNEFVEFCTKLTTEHPEVIEFLQGRYSKASPSYLASVEFRNTVGRCLTRVQAKRSKIFVYINELCTALKANSQKRKVNLQTQAAQQPTPPSTEAVIENDEETEDAPVKKTGSKRQIRYLENLLRIYSVEIKKLQTKELTLDELEDEDSSYIQESRLKRKLLRIFEKLCELKDCNSLTGRVIEQRILYRGTRYPEINRRLEKFINGSRDLFPDYGDVLQVVERANDKHRLGLSRKQMQSMAQDAFRELGNKLQDRRHLDMIYNFGCHLTDPYKSVNDPAVQDISLARRLRENRNMAMNRLDEIIKKYAELQDDGAEDHRMKTRKGPEKSRVSSSEGSEEEEEEEESEDSETDIEEELERSNKAPESEEENEEEVPADPENESDQKMDMASGAEDGEKGKKDGDDENVIEEQEEVTEQESSPASTSASSSHDKDSPNTTLDYEASDLPPLSNESSAKAKSDDEHNEEPEACETPENAADPMEVEQEHDDSAPNSVDTGSKETEDVISNCNSPSDTREDSAKHKNPQKFLLPDMTVSIEKDKENSGEGVTGLIDDRSYEGNASERSVSPGVQEEGDANVNMEESSAKRKSIDSEPGSMEGWPLCTDEAKSDDEPDHDPAEDGGGSVEDGGGSVEDGGGSVEDGGGSVEDGGGSVEDGGGSVEDGGGSVEDGGGSVEDGGGSVEDGGGSVEDGGGSVEDGGGSVEDGGGSVEDGGGSVEDGGGSVEDGGGSVEDGGGSVEDSAASMDHSPPDSPMVEREVPTTNVHTETTDLDTYDKDCGLSPLGSSNGVHKTAQVQSTLLNRLKLNKDKATPRDSPKPRNTEQASPLPNRKRKAMSPKKWTNNNGLTQYNGKEYTEDHNKKDHKRAKMDCSYTSLSSSSDSDSDSIVEDERTPGLMMTCSPRETPKKSTKKTHVSTQCDPDEVIVLSD
ncbi:death domain-associated protein 6 [Hyla sarda]|uniref:death domain-associated protein 6 n=1 Tax=Hyla sarda TaxID=327740 RepID=UPI0024C2667E|nr:death domain-associated protein 6 [Hyla sarda]